MNVTCDQSLPLVSYILFTYNQDKFIEDALCSALSQTYQPLEIIISDDCSTDGTIDKISSIVGSYNGPHKVYLNVNGKNQGVAQNINIATKLASGDFYILAAGDDISHQNRTTVVVELWLRLGKQISAIFSNATVINGEGKMVAERYFVDYPRYIENKTQYLKDSIFFSRHKVWILGATSCYSPDVFNKFDSIDTALIQEDGVLSFRSIILGGIAYIDECLVSYRKHTNSTFQPSSINKSLLLARKRFYFIKSCLKSAESAKDPKLISRVKVQYYYSMLPHILYSVPYIGKLVMGFKICVRNTYYGILNFIK